MPFSWINATNNLETTLTTSYQKYLDLNSVFVITREKSSIRYGREILYLSVVGKKSKKIILHLLLHEQAF